MSYILGVKWQSGCSELGDHAVYEKQVQVTPILWYIHKVYLKIYCFDQLRLIDNQYEIMFFAMM